MYNTLPELMTHYPIGARIKLNNQDNDYQDNKFVVEGYLYHNDKWYPARKLDNGLWEIYYK